MKPKCLNDKCLPRSLTEHDLINHDVIYRIIFECQKDDRKLTMYYPATLDDTILNRQINYFKELVNSEGVKNYSQMYVDSYKKIRVKVNSRDEAREIFNKNN